MSTKSDRETERQLEESYTHHKSYLKDDEDLKELCSCCEGYNGEEHNYDECKNKMCFKCFLVYKYLKWSKSYIDTLQELIDKTTSTKQTVKKEVRNMKENNGYWIDENENKWDKTKYTKEQAEKNSKALISCRFCTNCVFCKDCSGCINCESCEYCEHCSDCNGCNYCTNCKKCFDCRMCERCNDCNCCANCYRCENYKKNPSRYTTAATGSRKDNTTFYCDRKNITVVCGCFKGDLKTFEDAVLITHKNNEKHKNKYLNEIKKVKLLFDLEDEK